MADQKVERMVREKVRLLAQKELQLYEYPIHHAIRYGTGHSYGWASLVLRQMLQARSDPQLVRDKAGLLPIHYATANPSRICSIDIVKELLLVENPADRRQLRASLPVRPLHQAIEGFNDPQRETDDDQQLELVRCILDASSRADDLLEQLEAKDGRAGWVAIHFAAAYGSAALVRLLLEFGGSDWQLRVWSVEEQTPLHCAAQCSQHPDVIEALVSAGGSLDAADHKGRLPIHCAAASSGSPAVVQCMIKLGGHDTRQLTTVDSEQLLPVQVAAQCNCNREVVHVLMQRGGTMQLVAAANTCWGSALLANGDSDADARRVVHQARTTRLSQLFQRADKDFSTLLDPEELQNFLSEYAGRPVTAAAVEYVLRVVNASTGFADIAAEDVASAVSTWEALVVQGERVKAKFSHFDRQHTGTLSVAEVEQLLVWLGGGQQVSSADVAAVLAQADASNAGTLALEEVEAAVAAWYIRLLKQSGSLPFCSPPVSSLATPTQLHKEEITEIASGPGPTFLSVQQIIGHRKVRCFATVDLEAAGHEIFEASLVVDGLPLSHLLQFIKPDLLQQFRRAWAIQDQRYCIGWVDRRLLPAILERVHVPFGLKMWADTPNSGNLSLAQKYDAWLRGRIVHTIEHELEPVRYFDPEATPSDAKRWPKSGYYDPITGGLLIAETCTDELDRGMELVFYGEVLCALCTRYCSMQPPLDGTLRGMVNDLAYISLPPSQRDLVRMVSGRTSRGP
eukprot:SAG31_NODE_1004_length_10437_cov_2.754208_7_plen_738_part_00